MERLIECNRSAVALMRQGETIAAFSLFRTAMEVLLELPTKRQDGRKTSLQTLSIAVDDTASPQNTFCLFSKALDLSMDMDRSTAAAVLCFNQALGCHLRGISSSSDCFSTELLVEAFHYYQCVLTTASLDHMALSMAVQTNLGHLHSHLGYGSVADSYRENLRSLLLVTDERSMDIDDYLLALWNVSFRKADQAPAA